MYDKSADKNSGDDVETLIDASDIETCTWQLATLELCVLNSSCLRHLTGIRRDLHWNIEHSRIMLTDFDKPFKIVWHCCHMLFTRLARSSSSFCRLDSPAGSTPMGAGLFLLTFPCLEGALFGPPLYILGRRFFRSWIWDLTISDSLSSLVRLSCRSCLVLGSLNSEEEIIFQGIAKLSSP